MPNAPRIQTRPRSVNPDLELAAALTRALANRQFRLLYQPQVDVGRGAITGVEALLRWHHPRRGVLTPPQFLPAAEETGAVHAIGHWVLHTACADLARWRREGAGALRVAVNVSLAQLAHPAFVTRVLHALRIHGIPPARLEIELTEDGLMTDVEATAARLRRLAAHGVRIAVDDFGTGYSSLSRLHRLPIHTLKIDRSFTQDLRGRHAIISAIVGMARDLALHTVAEGVETRAQLTGVARSGCRTVQGFLFSRPVAAPALRGLLHAVPPAWMPATARPAA